MSSILSSILSAPSVRLINTQTGQDILVGFKAISANLRMPTQVMRHPLESGSSLTDTKIVLPAEVELKGLAPSLNVLTTLMQAKADNQSFYTLVSKSVVIPTVTLEEVLVEQSPKVLTATPVTLKIVEILGQDEGNSTSLQASDSPLKDLGNRIVSTAKQTVSGLYSAANNAAKFVTGAIGKF